MSPQPLLDCHATRFLAHDWNYYHANIFVDRDMFMRYQGGGVGHLYMHEIERWLWETGWGCDIPDSDNPETHTAEEDDDQRWQEEAGEGSDLEGESDSDSEDSESDEGDSEGDEEILEDEETLEGAFGYSAF
ncbi:hypothetical protein BDM02DRAFT_3192156 [Thelephora ganbajun]|uniref:Uncharacterized protein n=1 Tax=Thelephora ganbajun TaxID=370292 RepID=A0ACB6Z1J7_THEGA|nr:hypothetical protein BDM02DRAFT_3192156 [Thelephora ganbajun]